MLDKLQLKDFSGRVGETFRLILADDETVDVELVEATGTSSPPLERQPFSLVFRLPEEIEPAQAIHRLEHDELGALDLFLVPLGPGETGMRWEAVFT